MPVNTNAKVAIGFAGVVLLMLLLVTVLSIGTAVAANEYRLEVSKGANDD